jgi:hypothetical protein
MNFFLIITVGNLSLFFFTYPATLPKIFFIFPHSCILRGLYYQIKACVEDACIQSTSEIVAEHWICLCLPYIHFIVYFFLGIAFGESKVTKKLKEMIEFRKLRFSFGDQTQDTDRAGLGQTENSIELSTTRPTSVIHRGAGELTLGGIDPKFQDSQK